VKPHTDDQKKDASSTDCIFTICNTLQCHLI